MRLCDNPACRKPLAPERVEKHDAKSCDSACRSAAWKARTGYRHPSRRNAAERPQNGSQPRSRPRSGLQVSYQRAVEVLAKGLRWHLHQPLAPTEELVERILKDALPTRQRRIYDQRRERTP